ncbi:hypothetical protein HPB52_002620 [Rhipicephalus sanguineus]|uniref:Uncharacterized protein n=1 Tax=Rhipicephalus sanguineus TaxID=34632 RepID=A0A9D4QCZ8_RHISA|nr:hypothetical protein HPB52_002620 [Rhipicephalus sanguineus]
MKYFVYVKYMTDNVKKVTTSDHVQNFKPRDVNDFTPGDTYLVYWDGDDSTKGGYYDADFLHMTESKEEMDIYLSSRRVRHTKKTKKGPQSSTKEVSLNVRKLRVAGKRAATADLEQCHSCRHLEEDVQRLQAENSKPRTLNMRLQEQLLDRLSQAGMQATRSPPPDVADQDPWSPPCSSLQEDTYAPVDLGGVWKQVHLANGVLLQRATYDQLMGVQKDSHFVKRAAVAIWSSEVLAQRSFTGTLTNRFVAEGGQKAPQQPLTPHKVDALRGSPDWELSRVAAIQRCGCAGSANERVKKEEVDGAARMSRRG